MGVGAVAVAAVGCGRMVGVLCSRGGGGGGGGVWNSVWDCAGGRGWTGEEACTGGAACTGAGRAVFSTAAAMEQGRDRGAQMPSRSPEQLQSPGIWHKNRGGWGSREGGQAAVIPLIRAGGSTCPHLSSPLPWAWRCVGSKPEVASSCSPSQEAGHGVASGVGGEGQSLTVG